ncbi:MAG: ankyrin repeat domain-containing protein [Puniceicoccales bacterium]|nr:ankyrin repeat domain-containing protein [Puniceicoccales bacterium]
MVLYRQPRETWFDEAGKLYWAVAFGNKPLIKRLLGEGIDVNTPLADNQTALCYAILDGSIGTTRLLLNNGAKLNWKNGEGRSPLHLAAHCGSAKKIALLLDYGVDPNAQDDKGYTPLMLAVYTILFEMGRQGYHSPKRIPRNLSQKLRTNLKKESSLKKTYQYFPAMQLLVDRGAIPNAQDNEGNTAFHLAVSQPNGILSIECPDLKLLKELVALGVDVNIQNKKGETALDLIRQRKEKYCYYKTYSDQWDQYIIQLQEEGVDIPPLDDEDIPSLVDFIVDGFYKPTKLKKGFIPINLAQQVKEKFQHKHKIINAKYDQIIEFLLEHGAVEGHPKENSEGEEVIIGSAGENGIKDGEKLNFRKNRKILVEIQNNGAHLSGCA